MMEQQQETLMRVLKRMLIQGDLWSKTTIKAGHPEGPPSHQLSRVELEHSTSLEDIAGAW